MLPSPTGSPEEAALRFEPVAAFDDTELYAAAAFGGGFLVGGCRLRSPSEESDYGACAEARILWSIDGRSWTDTEVDGSAGRRVVGFADTPLGLLAFGSNQAPEPPLTRAVWRSTDGTGWEPFPMPAPDAIVFNHAFVLSGRTVLFGEDSLYDFSVETEAWATTDGRSWSRGEAPMSMKFAAAPGIVAIGDECVDLCPEDLDTHVRRSTDGFTWTDDAPETVPAFDLVRAWGTWAGRAVLGGALGDAGSVEAAVWFDEPAGWRAAPLPGGRGFAVGSIIDAGDRLIALSAAESGPPTRAWWTVDGRTWASGAVVGLGADDWLAAWAGDDPIVAIVDYRSIWLAAAPPTPAVPVVTGWDTVSKAGVTMTGSWLEEASATAPYARPDLPLSIRLSGLVPGELVPLTATASYEFAVVGCGRQPDPCDPGSGKTSDDPGPPLCTPLHARLDVTGTATATAQVVAGPDGTAAATIRLVVNEAQEPCPADPSLPWYVASGAWTTIGVTDAAHGLRLAPPDAYIGP